MSDARLIIPAVFFLLFVIVTMWGSEISAGARDGLEHSRAQAAAERRRAASVLRSARRRAREARATGGRGLASARRAATGARAGARTMRAGMRGPRPGAAPGSAVPANSGPGRRIAAAARRGAVAGARRVSRATVRRAPGLAARFRRRGQHTGTVPAAGGAPRPAAAPVGVCDSCNKVTPALQLTPVWTADGAQEDWLLCYECRRILDPEPPAGRPYDPAPAPAPASISSTSVPIAPVSPAAGVPAPPVLAIPASGGSGEPAPAGPSGAGPGQIPEPVLAGAVPVLTATGGTEPMTGEITVRPRAAAGRGSGAAAVPSAAGTDVAIRDNPTHGDWMRNFEAVIAALGFIKLRQDAMAGDLTSVNASRDQVRDITNWSADITAAALFIVTGLGHIDKRIQHLIEGYRKIGGVGQGADPAFYRDI